ncbi:MAG: 50S ribosomal protein L28 [Candidatus Omnitrophica bacterium]|nr:50S ribosomal protein L28 [Candidatus Omnitrophota bacterium]MBL7210337.1 50S ribosomal protein L28 [Candidatus Omnitrophota bacterium]
MLKKCAICDKGALTGKVVTRKGMAKSKGGTGSKISRWTKRKFMPNLQRMRILIKGHPARVYVCTKCIKKGALQRAI